MLVLDMWEQSTIYIGQDIKFKFLGPMHEDGKKIRIGIAAPLNKRIIREADLFKYYTYDEVERMMEATKRRRDAT